MDHLKVNHGSHLSNGDSVLGSEFGRLGPQKPVVKRAGRIGHLIFEDLKMEILK